MLILLTAVLAFAAGYAIRSGSICLVTAVRMLVVERKPARSWAFGFAAVASGTVIVPLVWALPETLALAPALPVTWLVVSGAVLFGLGARMNNGCVFGTLGQLTGGQLQYVFTIVGLVAGAIATEILMMPSTPPGIKSLLAEPDQVSIQLWLCFMAICLAVLGRKIRQWIKEAQSPRVIRFGPYRAMLVVGVCGGLLYTIQNDWGYSARLSSLVYGWASRDSAITSLPINIAAMMLVVGGCMSAYRTSSFRLHRPSLREVISCSFGGAMMGSAVVLVPGGNSALLIYGMPSFSVHAVVGYAVMTTTLCLSFAPQGWAAFRVRNDT